MIWNIYCDCLKRKNNYDFIMSDHIECNEVFKTISMRKLYCNEMVIVCRICLIEKIVDVVTFIEEMFNIFKSPENVTDNILKSLKMYNHLICDKQLTLLSRIHKQYSKKSDINAYAITTLWLVVVKVNEGFG